jgi:hypothetical protein
VHKAERQQGKPFLDNPMEDDGIAMPLQVFLFALFALLAGCTTTDYLGKTYPPTQHVDVFFSPRDLPRAYEVIGEIRAEGDDIVSYDSMQHKLVQEAMQ